MTDIAYAFNHDLLRNRVENTSGCELVVISLCSLTIPQNGKTCMHMMAEFCRADGTPITGSDQQIGCPYPPGWQDGRYDLSGINLKSCPKFKVSKTDILRSLDANQFRVGMIRQLCAHAEAEVENVSGVGTLVAHIKLLSKNENGSTTERIQKADAFKSPVS
jgi:hypothetical protein